MSELDVLREQQALSEAVYAVITRLAREGDAAAVARLLLSAALEALHLQDGLGFLSGRPVFVPHGAAGRFAGATTDVEAVQAELSAQATESCATQVAAAGPLTSLEPVGVAALGAGSRATVPLCLDGRWLGALVLECAHDPAFFTPPRQRFLHKLALQGAIALGRLEAFRALEGSEARSLRLIQESPVGIATGDLEGGLVEVNDAYLSLLGYTRAEFERGEINWAELTPPEYLEADRAAFERAFEHGSSGHYEKEMISRGGERVPLDLVLLRYAEGDAQRVVGYLQDLRLQRAAQSRLESRATDLQGQIDRNVLDLARQTEQLRLQNAELEARTNVLEGFADLSRDLTLDTDPYALIERAQAFALGLLPTEAFAVYYEPEDGLWRLRAQVGDLGNPALQAVLDAGLPFRETANLLIPWETRRPHYQDAYDRHQDTVPEETAQLQSTATLPMLVRGEPRGIFAVGLNVALPWSRVDQVTLESVVRNLGLALERAEQTLVLAHRTRALERSNQELEQFAYIASHDLQEPLRTVTSFAQLLVKRLGQGDDKAAQYAGLITSGTTRMQALIQDLLTFSRVSIQPKTLLPVSLDEVLRQVQQDLHVPLQASGVGLRLAPCAPVLGDPVQLRQLFQNLIGNALKFRVPERPAVIEVRCRRDGRWVHLDVQDNGIGIEPQYFERIFTAFQRLHGREQYEGNGIGLSIARKIVERHGGDIGVTSAPGEGTTFTVTLLAAQDGGREPGTAPHDPGSDLST